MIQQRRLTSDDSLRAFAVAYESNGGFRTPIEYLQASEVYGCFRDEVMIGGFVINETDNLRALQDMPQEDVDAIRRRFAGRRPYEIMCLWMIPEVRGEPAGTLIWLMSVSHCVRRSRRPLVMSTVHEKIYRLYEHGHPTVLYRGIIPMPDGSELPKYVLTFDSGVRFVGGFASVAFKRLGHTLSTRLRSATSKRRT
jgi:hypothetical protein